MSAVSAAMVAAARVRPFWLIASAMVVQVFMGYQYSLIATAKCSMYSSASGTSAGVAG
jgi:hypothetical protein